VARKLNMNKEAIDKALTEAAGMLGLYLEQEVEARLEAEEEQRAKRETLA